MLRDRGFLPLSIYPGQQKLIQFLNPDGSVWPLPTGATAIARCVDVLKTLVADLTPIVSDNSQGLITLSLPNTALVRSQIHSRTYYDIEVYYGEYKKYLGLSELSIQYSPSLWPIQNEPPSGGATIGQTTPNQTTPNQNQTPTKLYIQDQIWVNSAGERVIVQIEEQTNGANYFKLTQLL